MSKWFRKGDKVVVTSGNSKGQTGSILDIQKSRVLIQGVNIGKKHMKQRSQEQRSQIVEIERSIHISNVNFCDKNEKPVRIKARLNANGNKELYYLRDGKDSVLREVKNK